MQTQELYVRPGPNVIKLFCPYFMIFRNKLDCLFLAILFSLVLCLWVKARNFPRTEQLKGDPIRWAPALLLNIRLGYKGLPGQGQTL
jgi:hypothetical protein